MPFMTASGQIRPSRRIIVDGRSFSGAGKTAAIRSSRAAHARALFRGAPLGRCAALPGSPARFACLLLPAASGLLLRAMAPRPVSPERQLYFSETMVARAIPSTRESARKA
jgi:hypothetical protein